MSLALRISTRLLTGSSSCPSCRLRSLIHGLRTSRRRGSYQTIPFARYTSALASSSAINASRNIPTQYKALHSALEKLGSSAINYVNLSRLQLALKSLESEEPTIRIAVLGLGGQWTARRLARLLAADPLSDFGQWEDELNSMDESDERSVLLKFGTADEPAPSNPQVHTVRVPSPLLAKHNLEILVSPIVLAEATAGVDAESFKDAALVPMASTPRSFTGSTSFIRYPVHRAIIVAEGLPGCMLLGKQDINLMQDQEAVKVALNLSHAAQIFGTTKALLGVSIIDVIQAGTALDAFRQSNQNATAYEQGWFASGLPSLTTWLASSNSSGASLAPPVTNLIQDTLEEVSAAIVKEENERLQQIVSIEAPLELRQPLDDSVRFWAQRAHTELRDELDVAFESRNWQKLKWWKLFWRVDDVSMLLEDVLDRSWLVDAEKRLVWLIGRCTQAGIYDQHEAELQLQASGAATSTGADSLPLSIMQTRRLLRADTVPSLQAAAQGLVIQTASISGLGAALSGLLYAWTASPAAGVYEVGSLAALALIWSLRRMQRQWEDLKAAWQGRLREGGRLALQQSETSLRQAIKGTNRATPEVEVEGAEDRRRARQAVEEAARVLQTAARRGPEDAA